LLLVTGMNTDPFVLGDLTFAAEATSRC
jgi:hypothetical protein